MPSSTRALARIAAAVAAASIVSLGAPSPTLAVASNSIGPASAVLSAPPPQPRATAQQVMRAQADGDSLVVLAQAYLEAPSPSLHDRLWSLALSRQAELATLMRADPESAAASLLTHAQLAPLERVPGLPVEHLTTVTGRYVLIRANTWLSYVVSASGTTYSLYGDVDFNRVSSNVPVSVTGYQFGDQILVMGSGGGALSSGTAASTTPVTGTYHVAVLVGYFSDTSNPFNMAWLPAVFNGTPGTDVDDFYAAVSYGHVSISPSFYGAYQLSMTQSSACGSPMSAGSELLKAASSSAIYTSFQDFVYVLDCPNLTDQATVGPGPVSTPQGAVTAGQAWINTMSYTISQYYIHEIGHNMGLYHANVLECPPPQQFAPTCQNIEYGDSFDSMGMPPSGDEAGFNAVHRSLLGWLDATKMPSITQPGSYTYSIAPLEATSPTGPVALYIPRGNTGSGFTVEYRQPTGVDSWMQGMNVTAGASIAWVGSNGAVGSARDSEAIDATPGSQVATAYWNTNDYQNDGAFLPGMAFNDTAYGITIKVQSASASALTVQVTLAQACTLTSPTVAVSPSSQTAAYGGSALTYTVTVTDKDSFGCPTHPFHFNPSGTTNGSGPYGGPWKMDVSQGDLLLAPGTSGTWSMNVTSSPTATDGAFSFSSLAPWVGSSEGAFRASIPFTYVVSSPADATAPTAPTGLAGAAPGAAMVNLNWNASTDDVGVAGYRVFRNSIDITPLTPEVTGTSFTDYGVAPSTSYTYYVEAFDHKASVSGASASVTVTTPARTDSVAPTTPANFTVTGGDHSATASWSASTDNVGVAGYLMQGQRLPAATTSYTASPLPSSAPVTFNLAAFDADGNVSAFAEGNCVQNASTLTGYAAAPGTGGPSQPLGLTGTLVTSGVPSVSLTWNASAAASGVSKYVVYRNLIPLFSTTTTAFRDTSIVANDSYQYQVQAVDTKGNVSALSSYVSVSGPNSANASPTATLSAPTPGPTLSGIATVSVSGTDSLGIVQVEYLVDGVLWGSFVGPSNTFSFDTAGLSNGAHTLLARVLDTALNVGSSSAISVTISNQRDTTPPSTPANPAATPVSSSEIDLSWTASTDDVAVAGYYIYRDGVQVAAEQTTTYADLGLSAGTPYSYDVSAYDSAGNVSPVSGTASATTLSTDTTPPSTPANLTATAIDSGQVNLTWTPSTDDVSVAGYTVYRNGSLIATTRNASYSDTTVAASTKYSYYVKAFDLAGNVSAAANKVSVAAPPLSGALSGQVSASTGASLNGATVTIKAKGVKKSVTTDASGAYMAPALTPGTYQATYSAAGYASLTVTVTISGNQITVQNAALS